ncbi:MAG TPA: cytochrome c oxidase subunit 3, partial [Novimethylophilus sp.]
EAWGIPAINTLILLSSGATVTWAHWGLKRNNRTQIKIGLALTILLGALFLALQTHEYMSADFSLKTGIYGATFYMLTGFHGAHVTLGAIMLTVILGRVIAGHFTADRHFAFEAVSWYWHFVDVVWLMLFVFVYWM